MKKLLSLVLALLLSASCMFITASAAGDSMSAASSINVGSSYSGSITSSSNVDFYKFTLSNSGCVRLKVSAGIQYLYFYIYDSNGNSIWESGLTYWNYTTELIVLDKYLDLTSGSYYFCIKQGSNGYTGNYNFSTSFSSANESFKETQSDKNNTTSNSDNINMGTTYKGQIALNDNKDFYKFTVSSSGSVNLSVSASMQYAYFYIYDSSAKKIWNSGLQFWDSSTGLINLNKSLSLSAGTYYFEVEQASGGHTGNYSFKLSSSSGSSSITLSVSSTSVSLEKGDTTKVNCSYTGSNANGISISYSVNNKNIATCEWGEFSNKRVPLTIKGVSVGSTTVTISLKDRETGAVLDSETISVKVTEEGSGSGSGNTGNSGGGESIFITIIMFPIRAIIWFFGLFF